MHILVWRNHWAPRFGERERKRAKAHTHTTNTIAWRTICEKIFTHNITNTRLCPNMVNVKIKRENRKKSTRIHTQHQPFTQAHNTDEQWVWQIAISPALTRESCKTVTHLLTFSLLTAHRNSQLTWKCCHFEFNSNSFHSTTAFDSLTLLKTLFLFSVFIFNQNLTFFAYSFINLNKIIESNN